MDPSDLNLWLIISRESREHMYVCIRQSDANTQTSIGFEQSFIFLLLAICCIIKQSFYLILQSIRRCSTRFCRITVEYSLVLVKSHLHVKTNNVRQKLFLGLTVADPDLEHPKPPKNFSV